MLDSIILWDQKLFLFINQLRAPWLDPIMKWVSDSYIPIFIILALLIYFGIKFVGKKTWILVLLSLLLVGASDSFSSRVLKPGFERLRPCYEPTIQGQFSTVGNCWGGKYGFVSSHASNSFAIAFFLWLVFRRKYPHFFWLLPYAAIVSYTRIYLAKHYPLDLVFGALLGIFFAFLTFKVWKKVVPSPTPVNSYPN